MRRKCVWFLAMVALIGVTVLGACQPKTVFVDREVEKVVTQVVTEKIKETVIVEGESKVVEKEVTKIVEVEKEVEVVRVLPVEFTRQIVQYNSPQHYENATGGKISSYQQSPMLDALVADGTLPPVEDRLPDIPLVMQPADGIGTYGGTMVSGGNGEAWSMEDLLREFPHVYSSEMKGVLPNVFMNAETSADGKTFTFTIRPGIKWSDGEPFGADDFVFWYEAIAMNKELSPSGVNDLKVGGEMGTVTKIDENTIAMEFVAPYGVLLERLNRWRPMPYAPAHYLKQFHPDYTDQATLDALVKERGYTSWTELFEFERYWYSNPNIPTIFAWKAVTEGTSAPVLEFERNPYFWKVDIAGNQLPYVDKVQLVNLGDTEGIVLKAIAGELDYQHQEWFQGSINYPVLKQNEQKGNYKIYPQFGWCDVVGSIVFNMSIDDPVLRKLFNNKDFRIALSLGFDRNEVNEVVFNGLFKPSQPAPPDRSVYNGADPAFLQYTEHDVDRANEILDNLGLTWNDDKTQRFLPDGRPFELGIQVLSTGVFPDIPVTELMAQGWKDLGLKSTIVPLPGDLLGERRLAGDYELQSVETNVGGQAPIIGALRGVPMPISRSWLVNPPWAQWVMSGGAEGEEPPDDVKRLYEIFEEFVAEPDPQKRFELEKEMYAIHNDNLWIIGAVKAPADLPTTWYAYFSNRMYNIPNPVAGEFYYAAPETWAKRAD